MEEKIVLILNEMSEYLSIAQMKKLQEVVLKTFSENEADKQEISNNDFLQMFLDAKRIEGCSERTIQYYRVTVEHLFSKMNQSVRRITTEEIRTYLSDYQKINRCSNVTIDNIRRNISSFFSWLEEEDYILKSPMKRIHKIKTKTVVKSVITDEGIEKLRDNCAEIRDLAIIDLLYSTGIRVGELVNLNIEDIDLEGRECIVYGKGDKERRVYFDAKAKVHLKEYIEKRKDNNEALFVTLDAPHDRLKISGVEIRLVHIIGMDFSIISSLLVLIAGTMVGIMFSMVAIESGSVWNSGIVHSLWNILIIGGGLSISEKADEYSVMTYVLDSKDFVFTGGEFGIESSIIALLGYVIVTLAAICMIKKKAKV